MPKKIAKGTPGYCPLPLSVDPHTVHGKRLTDEIRHYMTIDENKKRLERESQTLSKILGKRDRK